MLTLVGTKWMSASVVLLVAMAVATAVAAAVAGPQCARLAAASNGSGCAAAGPCLTPPPPRRVRVRGEQCAVTLLWRGAAEHALAALLQAALRHTLLYQRVQLAEGPTDLCAPPTAPPGQQECTLAVVSAAQWGACTLPSEWRVLGAAAAPERPRLHVRLGAAARARPACARAASYAFYADAAEIQRCGFDRQAASGAATVYVPRGALRSSTAADVAELVQAAASAALLLRLERCPRDRLLAMLRDDSHSLLFLDYELYAEAPHTAPVQGARCACACAAPREPARVLDARLQVYAPLLADVVRRLAPRPAELQQVLALAARDAGGDVEEAACRWATGHGTRFRSWIPTRRYDYWVAITNCTERDPDRAHHRAILEVLARELWDFTGPEFGIELKQCDVNCSDPGAMMYLLTHSVDQYRCVGLVAGAEGALFAASAARASLPVVMYEAAGAAPPGVRLATGGVRQLARALRHFLDAQGWRRVAVLSEPTELARALGSALRAAGGLALRVVRLSGNVTRAEARAALLALKEANARVMFVNAGAAAAGELAGAAARLDMAGEQYAWLAREWRGGAAPRVFTVTFGCREEEEAEGGRAALRRRLADKLASPQAGPAGRGLWGPRAAALVDAVLTLGYGFEALVRLHPEARHDPHAQGSVRLLWDSFDASNVSGLCQELRYRGDELARPLVVLAEWRGGARRALARWRAGAAPALPRLRPAVSDGSEPCTFPAGDEFAPGCRDTQWILLALVGALALALAPLAAVGARRAVARRLARYRIEVAAQVMARRQAATQAIVGHLVERSAVEVRRELGAGQFGQVRLAVLRVAGRAPRAVAAKALREGAAPAEESEFLREACTLAALEHEHVVRLVGVCVTDGPPLVLMEYAFFGDLLRYLRARRHLAEGAEDASGAEGAEGAQGAAGAVGAEETAHVSAQALTRLVREAASALGYLAYRGIVHRDVRAANCLVDAGRRLKLADFGMARDTKAGGADGVAEYACRRRGLFPVLWMAPESLDRGAFSAASDVWALGVLALEVVTLGARPYGARSPLRVLQYVLSGGRPPLPLDATAQTRGVALACWRRRPRERPSAADVVAYLAARPAALRPALAADCDGTDADSGFGEPDAPSPPDSPPPPLSSPSPTPRDAPFELVPRASEERLDPTPSEGAGARGGRSQRAPD